MKTLILVRHAKSSWEYPVDDKDRPLKQRGINDAHIVSNAFKHEDVKPDFIYSSPANRALHTSMIFIRNLDLSMDYFRVSNSLYDFSGSSVYEFISKLDDSFNIVMIFGHNNALTNIVNTIGNSYIDNVPTSGLVQINFNDNNWNSIKKGVTVKTIFPKQFKI